MTLGPSIKTIKEPEKDIRVIRECDVVVVGGGPGGFAAALAAARNGADTVLVERYGHLGGMATGGLVTIIPNMSSFNGKVYIKGICEEWMNKMDALDAATSPMNDELGSHVKKPLEGMKIAGYVGCQTNRPFGVDGESFENPMYLDKLSETLGAEALTTYEKKVQCCGGALAFSEPEKSQAMIKDIIESAYDHGADLIVTPCPVCQMNVEVYQPDINKKYKTKFNMPVVYYSTLMSVAYGSSAKEAGLDGQIIKSKQLEEIASK